MLEIETVTKIEAIDTKMHKNIEQLSDVKNIDTISKPTLAKLLKFFHLKPTFLELLLLPAPSLYAVMQ